MTRRAVLALFKGAAFAIGWRLGRAHRALLRLFRSGRHG